MLNQTEIESVQLEAEHTGKQNKFKKRLVFYGLSSLVVGILVWLALPNFIGACDTATLSTVRANAHTFQTIVETYAVDWGGVYPVNVKTLENEATKPLQGSAYWKDFMNPITGYEGFGQAYGEPETPAIEGMVVYFPILGESVAYPQQQVAIAYRIYAYGAKSKFITDKDEVFYLSNG